MSTTLPDIDQDTLTWQQFNDEVLNLMPQDKQRIGLKDYIPRLIRQGAIDLQKFIPSFRKRNETIYYPQDFVDDGAASVGALPPGRLTEAWMFKLDRQKRYTLEQWPWNRRFMLVNDEIPDKLSDESWATEIASMVSNESVYRLLRFQGKEKYGQIALEPGGSKFYVFPRVLDGWVLSLFWEGMKFDYRPDELVPFGEAGVLAVSWYAKAHIALEVDRDSQRAADMNRLYQTERTNLYLNEKSKGDLP